MLVYLFVILAVVVISYVFIGFNIFFRKKSFPETEVGRNRDMRRLGLTCPKCDEVRTYRKSKKVHRLDPGQLKMVKPE